MLVQLYAKGGLGPDAQSTPNTATICPACACWMSCRLKSPSKRFNIKLTRVAAMKFKIQSNYLKEELLKMSDSRKFHFIYKKDPILSLVLRWMPRKNSPPSHQNASEPIVEPSPKQ